MAYHAGAELTDIECFQINPLIKDYNGPACAYVSGPFGGYTVNAKGDRFMLDYWSGQMMWEFYRELHSENGPVYLKMDHLASESLGRSKGFYIRPSARAEDDSILGEGTAMRATWSRCPSRRSACAVDTAARGSGSTSGGRRRSRGCIPRGTWPRSRMATCSAPSPTARSAGGMRSSSSALSSIHGLMTGRLRQKKGEPCGRCRISRASRPTNLIQAAAAC